MYDIDVSGDIAAFINRLEKFDKDVSKALKAEMRKASGDVTSAARNQWGTIGTPLSGWAKGWNNNGRDRTFSSSRAKSGVKVRTYRARKAGATVAFGYQVVQSDPAAAIFELAGTNNDDSRPGRGGSDTFNQNLINRFTRNPRPRVLYPSYYQGIATARKKIEQAVREAARKVGL